MHRCLEIPELLDIISEYCSAQTLLDFAKCCKGLHLRVMPRLYASNEVPLSGILSHAPSDVFVKHHVPHKLNLQRSVRNERDWERIVWVAKHVRKLRASWDGFNTNSFNRITKWSGYPTPLFPKLHTLLWKYDFFPPGALSMLQMLINPDLTLLILGGERVSKPWGPRSLSLNQSMTLLKVASTVSPSLPSMKIANAIVDGNSLRPFVHLCFLAVELDHFKNPEINRLIAALPSLHTLHLEPLSQRRQEHPLPEPHYVQGDFPALQCVSMNFSGTLRNALPWSQLRSITARGGTWSYYGTTELYQSAYSLLKNITGVWSSSPPALRQLRLLLLYGRARSTVRLDLKDMLLSFTKLTTLEIIFKQTGFKIPFGDEDILRIVSSLPALEHFALQTPMTSQRFAKNQPGGPTQTDMPTARSLIYIAEYCSSIRTVDMFVKFQAQFPSVVAPNGTLQEIAFGRSWITAPITTASFLHILFPNLKVFNVTADKDYLVSNSLEDSEVKQAWESAQEMARLCGVECFAKTYDWATSPY
ncbi:hypothetical protein DL96DRAFT_1813013 [Flagelloscypha sp. PMI_526]|nr:hypothetical protein DL96DRAFT_1813013 [Flagelloscypha sp. PMI_526]